MAEIVVDMAGAHLGDLRLGEAVGDDREDKAVTLRVEPFEEFACAGHEASLLGALMDVVVGHLEGKMDDVGRFGVESESAERQREASQGELFLADGALTVSLPEHVVDLAVAFVEGLEVDMAEPFDGEVVEHGMVGAFGVAVEVPERAVEVEEEVEHQRLAGERKNRDTPRCVATETNMVEKQAIIQRLQLQR